MNPNHYLSPNHLVGAENEIDVGRLRGILEELRSTNTQQHAANLYQEARAIMGRMDILKRNNNEDILRNNQQQSPFNYQSNSSFNIDHNGLNNNNNNNNNNIYSTTRSPGLNYTPERNYNTSTTNNWMNDEIRRRANGKQLNSIIANWHTERNNELSELEIKINNKIKEAVQTRKELWESGEAFLMLKEDIWSWGIRERDRRINEIEDEMYEKHEKDIHEVLDVIDSEHNEVHNQEMAKKDEEIKKLKKELKELKTIWKQNKENQINQKSATNIISLIDDDNNDNDNNNNHDFTSSNSNIINQETIHRMNEVNNNNDNGLLSAEEYRRMIEDYYDKYDFSLKENNGDEMMKRVTKKRRLG